jgi:hypothetical protein
MLSGDPNDKGTSYNYAEAIATIRQYLSGSGGLNQFSDDQIRFIIEQRCYYQSVQWAGKDITDASPDPHGWGWGPFSQNDIIELVPIISAAGLMVDANLLFNIYEGERQYCVAKKLIEDGPLVEPFAA